MRTPPAALLPIFRSEMQLRLLGLLLLQPERRWTLHELARALGAPASSVHRELGRVEQAGIVTRDISARPYAFQAAPEDPLFSPLAELLRLTVGVEEQLRTALQGRGIAMAVIHGSWASGQRRPDSDIDILVVGDADLSELRRQVRPVGRSAGRTIDLVIMKPEEFRQMIGRQSSFTRSVLDNASIPLIGSLDSIARDDKRTRREIYEDQVTGQEFFAQAEKFFTDATKPDLSTEAQAVLFHSAAVCACDAVLQVVGLRVTGGDGSHLLRMEAALEQLDGNHDDLLERLDVSRWYRNNVSYAAGFMPETSAIEAREATAELIELARKRLIP